MPETGQRRMILCAAGLAAVITAVCFLASDRPDKVYLNPGYVDAVVLVAGLFLVAEALAASGPRLWAAALRAAIGAAMITIHLFQFLMDLARRLSPAP